MNQIQITFINGELFVWGISSDHKLVFTPTDMLEIFLKR